MLKIEIVPIVFFICIAVMSLVFGISKGIQLLVSRLFLTQITDCMGDLTLESISGEDWPEVSWHSYIVVEDYGMRFLY